MSVGGLQMPIRAGTQGARAGASPLRLSRVSLLLFLVFATYLVLPIVDVPLLGLSASAPLLFFVALDLFFISGNPNLRAYGRWLTIAYLFGMGLLLSLAGNYLLGTIEALTGGDVVTLVQFAYWLLAFIIAIVLVSRLDIIPKLSMLLGCFIVILGILRLGEAIFFGRWGAWAGTQILTENGYGFQFSMFFSFALMLPLILKGWKRGLAVAGLLAVGLAILGNGSRSSWITSAVGVGLFGILYVLTQRKRISSAASLIGMLLLFMVVFAFLPSALLEPVNQRFSTFQTLNEDKSYAIRLLMDQKAERLFEQNPLLGAGIGRFREASVPLDIPPVLSYAAQYHFDVKSAHNSYLSLLGETGLVGVLPFGILLALLAVGGLRATLRSARRGELWAIPIYTSFVCVSIHLWSLAGLTGTAPWFVYGILAGLIERDVLVSQTQARAFLIQQDLLRA